VKKIIILLLKLAAGIAVLLVFTGCASISAHLPWFRLSPDDVTVISDLAYDVNPHLGFTVYLTENGVLTPYLVLTNNYNGHTLLLRKYLLCELMRYDPEPPTTSGFAAYYGDSELGIFLDEVFIKSFSETIQEIIVNSEIVITARHSLHALADNDLVTIERRVFLLSRYETNARQNNRFLNEGERLRFFSTSERRIAYNIDGVAISWWIRTPSITSSPYMAGIVNLWGGHSSAPVYNIIGYVHLGVRPAFCLPNSTPVRRSVVNGEYVFLLYE